MSSLEQIVLPLAESRALAEKVKLDTVMVWVRDPNTGDISVDSKENRDVSLWSILCPAPVLSELLDAIRKKQPYAVVQCGDRPRGYVGSEKRACLAMQPEGCSDIRYGDTDLLAAYALLLEVAK